LAAESFVLRGGTLVDGTGSDPLEDASVVVRGSEIHSVGRGNDVEVPDGARVIDVRGRTVLPGLIDSHLHFLGLSGGPFISESLVVPQGVKLLRAAQSARAVLEAGFTTAKDTGGMNAIHLKRAVDEGTIPGPRILAAGYVLTQTAGHGDDYHFLPVEWADARTSEGKTHALICDGVDECIRAARYAFRDGADFIKVCTSGGVSSQTDKPEDVQFSHEEVSAIVEVARKVGSFVTTHCMSSEGMLMSIESGVRTIDHAWYPTEEVIELGRKKGTVFVSTLSAFKRIEEEGGTFADWEIRKSRGKLAEIGKNMRRLKDGGATVASGTDYIDTPLMKMGTNALELELLVKYAGFTPMESIVSMTANGALACGMEGRIGTVEKGRLADLLVVKRNPLEDIGSLQSPADVESVVKGGAFVKRA
jgi:imidazolonepropionase-like amidohydrolase